MMPTKEELYKEYRNKYVNGIDMALSAPVDVSLELSSLCNLACHYCYHGEPSTLPFKRKFMPMEMARNLITQAAKLEVSSLKMNWRGESTMNPNFSQICKLAKSFAREGTFIDRITNSNFMFDINKDEIFEGLRAQTKVKVSYDSFTPDVLHTQRAKSDWHKITSNIDKFYNFPARDNELVIQAVRTKLNENEDIEGLAKKRWPSATISIRDVVEGRLEGDIEDYKVKDRDVSDRQSCLQAHVRLIFAWNGDASPCCPDIKQGLVLGNINKESLFSIWTSVRAMRLRKALKEKTAFHRDPCKNCSSFESYKGYKAPCHS